MNQLSQLSGLTRYADNFSIENVKLELQSLQSKLATLRPVQEFLNFKKVSKPQNFGDLQSRVSYNLRYFSTNYALIVGALSIYTLLTNLLLLFVIVFVFFGLYGINKLNGQDLVLPFGVLKVSQLYTALTCIAVPLGFVASPFSTLMWLIGASAVSVLGHASFVEKPIETVFEEETV
ncbi:PRA1 family protein [Lachancea thermotolerans]|uniref:PRA1 family protein n=1 Tax=Lachancea thermotolerans (strain ATCC 56472 / CBS 6340 / NRRL Y-8284) TaxID=559295 RepID=C5DML9_LACTC|nr:KLTH0G09988p [Lachancea thermotolerans CBS 6340]CAR25030.1 KLTH0G09988p [Lachancea thermotolerans CBS 6340]